MPGGNAGVLLWSIDVPEVLHNSTHPTRGMRWVIIRHPEGTTDPRLVSFVKRGRNGKLLDQVARWAGNGWDTKRWVPRPPQTPRWLLQKVEGHMGRCIDACLLGNMTAGQLARAADLIERQSAPVPVAVSERPWEREGWCHPQERWAWFYNRRVGWRDAIPPASLKPPTLFPYTHSLPFSALPLPSGEVEA